MILDIWQPEAKPRAQFNLHQAERRAHAIVERNLTRGVILAVLAYRAWVLGAGRAGDVRRRVGGRS